MVVKPAGSGEEELVVGLELGPGEALFLPDFLTPDELVRPLGTVGGGLFVSLLCETKIRSRS